VDEIMIDVLELRRTAKEVKRHVVLMRILGLLMIILILIVAVAYAISYFYDKFGSFTVKVNKYDMVHQGLSLSETPEYDRSIAVLNANIVYDMTNISKRSPCQY
jgi:predicted membrane protein